jgi:hypothetical protein
VPFLRTLINHPDVQGAKTHVRWIENLIAPPARAPGQAG